MTKILFLGDVYLEGAHDVGRFSDLPYVINLEAPFYTHHNPVPGKINLGMRWADFDRSLTRRPLAVCLANNHIMDYGVAGLENTLQVLAINSMPFFGAGRASKNYHNPLLLTVDGMRIAFFGYCSAKPCLKAAGKVGPAPLQRDLILRDIGSHRNAAGRIVINLHWGREEADLPDSNQVDLARELIDAGADAIVSHHSHSIQPVETYAQGIIAYGLGNFIFPDLCLPAFFDKAGMPFRIYKKKQRKWNRSSIGLIINFETMGYEIKYLLQKGARTVEEKNGYHQVAHKGKKLNSEELDRIAERQLQLRMLNIMCANFLRSPSLSKIFNFIKNRGIRL